MSILKISLQSLKNDLLKSIFYFLTFLLTTIFIFTFFNLICNESAGIRFGGQDTTMTTTITIITVFIAMLCVFIANDFYVNKKTKMVSVMLMSGATELQVGRFIFYQTFLLMLLSIPLGLCIGMILTPVIGKIFLASYGIKYVFAVSGKAIGYTAFIIGFEVLCSTYCNIGYCHRSSITDLVHAEAKIDLSYFKIHLSHKLYIILYVLPMIIFFTTSDSSGYLFASIIGIIGAAGIVKEVIPEYLTRLQHEKYLNDPMNMMICSYVKYDISKIFVLLMIILMTSIFLMTVTVYNLKDPFVSMLSLIAYASVSMLMSLTILFKLSMEVQLRNIQFRNLSYIGFDDHKLKMIIKKEMILFYGIILCIPMMYQIIMVLHLWIASKITAILALSILLIFILPILFAGYMTKILYNKTVLIKRVL